MGFKEDFKKQGDALRKDDMLLNIIKEVQKEGVVGEEDTILALLLKFTMRLVINSEPTSSNVIVSDESGGGKDNLVKAIGNAIVKKDCYMHRNGMSPKIFTYWHSNDDEWTWKDKVLHIEDAEEELVNCQGFKTMASGNPNKVVVKDQKAAEYRSNGKPVLIITSRESQIAMEGVRRWDAIQVDTSNELSEAIVVYISQKEMGNIDETPDMILRSALQNLPPRHVIIPFAGELIPYLPHTVQIRTQYHKLLDYVKASAVLHQYQRKVDDKHCIVANLADLVYAWFAYEKFGNEFGVPLNIDEVDFMKILIEAGRPLRISQILHRFKRGKDWVYSHLDKLKSVGLIHEDIEFDELTHRDVLTLTANESMLKVDRAGHSAISGLSVSFLKSISDTTSFEKNDKKSSFLSFLAEIRIIDIYRASKHLSPKFNGFLTNIEETTETTNNHNLLTTTTKEKGEPGTFRKSPSETTRNDQKRLDLGAENIDLRDFVNNTQSLGSKVTKDLLYKNFDNKFIDETIKRNILIKGSNGYEIKG